MAGPARPTQALVRREGDTFGVATAFTTGTPVHLAWPRLPHGVAFHRHEFLEIALVLAGTAEHRTLVDSAPLRPGDALVIPPFAWHAYAQADGLALCDCCIDVAILDRQLAWLAEDPLLARVVRSTVPLHVHLDPPGRERAESALRRLHDLRCRRARTNVADQFAAVLAVVGELARVLPEQAPAALRHPHPAVREAMALMEQDLARAWSIEQVARTVAVTRTHLARLFARDTGHRPLAWLFRRRAELAATLLAHTDRPVTDIGRTVGWPDPSHFARRFRAVFRCSPGAWRHRRG